MAVIVENGTGVAGANSFVTVAFVTAYLTARNRQTENGWAGSGAEEDAAVIEATDYIEARFSQLFKGAKEYEDLRVARATLELTAQPSAGDTVVIGAVTYSFEGSLGGANDVLIGANTSESVDNLIDAVNANPATAGTVFHASTVENDDAGAQAFFGDTLLAFAKVSGTPGNAVTTTTTITGATWNFATLNGGGDRPYPQPLSFPRDGLFDRDGIQVFGMPEKLKQATAEYAVRARAAAATLAPDPTADSLGGTVTRLKEKIGPIETDTEYLPGTVGSGSLPAYPAADRLLRDFVTSGGRVVRG